MPGQRARHTSWTVEDLRLRPLTKAIKGAWVALMSTTLIGICTPHAQAADLVPSTDGHAQSSYQVSAGPLGPALMDFAAQAGVNLSVNLNQLKALRTSGLSGTYSTEDGFARLLDASGFRVKKLGASNYALEADASQQKPVPNALRTGRTVADAPELAPVVVSATRLEQESRNSPQNITVLTHEAIEEQLAFTSSTTQILSNLIPSMAPAMQKMSNYGQTMRGLQPLIMVDGIPQSSPMYTSTGRDMTTIDPSMIDRIEVIQGANSSNGIGGMGGVINIITKQARSGDPHQHVSVEMTSPTSQLKAETNSYKVTYGVDGSHEDIDYLFNVSYLSQGAFLDGSNQRIGTYDDQGDLMDSRSYDLMAKAGYWIDDNQRIGFSINRYHIKNNNKYSLVSGDRENGIPTTSARDTPQGKAPYNDSWTVGATYDHYDLDGMKLNATLYYQAVDSLFRGNMRFLNQQAYDQSHASFDKIGAKITLTTADFMDDKMKATFGLDAMHETSSQKLYYSDLYWVPKIRYTDVAPFAQLEFSPVESVKIVGGVRYEHASLDVDSFTTLPRYGSKDVEGGKFSFGKTLFNLGASWSPIDSLNLFANYSQGFKVPDMGKAIRGISVDGAKLSNVSYFKPDIADNYEVGFRINDDRLALQASYFYTKVKPGTVISYSNDQWVANRYVTEIDGIELNASYQINSDHQVGLGYSHLRGRYDINGNGRVDTKLDGANIAPDRLNVSWSANWSERLTSTIQANWYFKRSFDGDNSVNTYDADQYQFSGYGLVDLAVGYKLPKGQLTLGVANLLNKQYITYYSQSGIVGDDYFFAGQGRTVTLGYRYEF